MMRYIYLSKNIRISVLLPGALFLMLVRAGAAAAVCFALAAAVHEAGHLIAGRLLGYKVKEFTVGLTGADIRYARALGYKDDIAVSLAGPLAGIAAGVIAFPFCVRFAEASVIYGALNLIPAGMFDGGRALSAFLYYKTDFIRAGRITAAVSLSVIFPLYLVGVFMLLYTSFNGSLLMLCVYAFVKTAAEADGAEGTYF